MPIECSSRRRAPRWARAALALGLAGVLSAPQADAAWSRADTARELGYVTLVAVDGAQTREGVGRGDREINPFLGPHPSVGEIDRYMVAAAAIHGAISTILPESSRVAWQWGTLIGETLVVAHNAIYIGLGIRF